jgi:hypothetical protein
LLVLVLTSCYHTEKQSRERRRKAVAQPFGEGKSKKAKVKADDKAAKEILCAQRVRTFAF